MIRRCAVSINVAPIYNTVTSLIAGILNIEKSRLPLMGHLRRGTALLEHYLRRENLDRCSGSEHYHHFILFGFQAGPRACVYLASLLTSLPLIRCASPQRCITSKGALPCFPCLIVNLSRVIF